MKKKWISLILLLVLLLSLGTTAFAEGEVAAEGEEQAAEPGDGSVQKGDIVYLGRWNDAPIRWRILDPDATNVGEPGVFLFSEQTLTNQGVVYSWSKAEWQGSESQTWCSDLLTGSFTELEQAAIPAVSKTEEGFEQYGLNWGAVSLEEEKVFFISIKELGDYIGPNDGDPGISTSYVGDGRITYYWVRTPHGIHGDYAGLVLENDQVHDYLVYGSWGARPATNLGGEGFLYLSPADRTLGPCDLGPLPASANHEWKATAADPSLGLEVTGTRFSGGQLTINYSGAPANAWISVLVRDAEGRNLSYACLSQTPGGDGTVSLIPEVPEGASLYLFAEQDNGPQNTNAASALCPVTWEEEPEPTPTPAPTPVPDEPEESGGSISLVSVSPLPVDPNDHGLKTFLRQYWMFAIPFAFFSVAAIVVAVVQAILRRRAEEYGYYDDYDE